MVLCIASHIGLNAGTLFVGMSTVGKNLCRSYVHPFRSAYFSALSIMFTQSARVTQSRISKMPVKGLLGVVTGVTIFVVLSSILTIFVFGIDFENMQFFCFDCRIGNNIFSLDDFAFGSGDTLFLLRSTFLDVTAADEGSPRHGSVDVFFLFKVLVSSSFVAYGLGVFVTVTVLLSDERR